MPSAFNVTAATNDVPLDGSRQGAIQITISNISGAPQKGRVTLAPLNTTKATWLSVDGAASRSFPVGGSDKVVVKIAVPADAAPGHYTFRPDVVAEDNPDENSTQGPTVAFEVPAIVTPPPPPTPWWLYAAIAAVVVLVIGVVAYLFVLTKIVPNVVGADVGAAQTTLASAGLQAGTPTPRADLTQAPGTVLSQDPSAGSRVGSGSTVNLVVAAPNVLVPNVVGQPFITAQFNIKQAGLTPPSAVAFCSATTNVVSQNPAAGTRVAPGTNVGLSCFRFEPPPRPPVGPLLTPVNHP